MKWGEKLQENQNMTDENDCVTGTIQGVNDRSPTPL